MLLVRVGTQVWNDAVVDERGVTTMARVLHYNFETESCGDSDCDVTRYRVLFHTIDGEPVSATVTKSGHTRPDHDDAGIERIAVTYLPSEPSTLRADRPSVIDQMIEVGFLTIWESLVVGMAALIGLLSWLSAHARSDEKTDENR